MLGAGAQMERLMSSRTPRVPSMAWMLNEAWRYPFPGQPSSLTAKKVYPKIEVSI